mgnify:CR=1 FL=1
MPLPELPELEELYRLYRTDLYRYLCHLTHDPAEAEDLTKRDLPAARETAAHLPRGLRCQDLAVRHCAQHLPRRFTQKAPHRQHR